MKGLIFDIDDTLYSRQDLFVEAAREVTGSFIADASEFVRVFYAKSDLNTADAYLELQSHMSLSPSMRDVLTKLSEEPGISLGVLTAGELYEKSAELSYHDPFDRILILHISVSHI